MSAFLIAFGIMTVVSVLFWLLERTPLINKNLSPWKYSDLNRRNILYLFSLLVFMNYHGFEFIVEIAHSLNQFFSNSFGGFFPRYDLSQYSVVFEIVAVFLLADLITYLNHRFILHGPLWHYHAVHHSETAVSWNSAYQFHPIDFVSHRLCYVVVFFFLEIRPETMTVFMIAYFYGLIQHSRIDISFQPAKWLLATPQFHRLHHRFERAYHHKNFATWLSVWDRVFKTHAEILEGEKAPIRYGVPDELGLGTSFWRQLVDPLKRDVERVRRKIGF